MERKKLISLFLLILFVPSPGLTEDAIKVKAIEIRGNKKIEKASIVSKIKTFEGEAFSQEKIQEDIKSIFEIGSLMI